MKKIALILLSATLLFAFAGCSKKPIDPTSVTTSLIETTPSAKNTEIIIQHGHGETVITGTPERVVSLGVGSADLALALGVTPIGVSEVTWGVLEDDNLLPWTLDAFEELGVTEPNIFFDGAGSEYDFEAISASEPDVILATYSGMTKEDYDILSQIAPVVPYPGEPWLTPWRDTVLIESKAMGKEQEGIALVEELDTLIAKKAEEYSDITGKSFAFLNVSASDLGTFWVYFSGDTRVDYFADLGFEIPESVKNLKEEHGYFTVELSAENAQLINDVDFIVTYGDENLLPAMQADPLIGTILAVKNGQIAILPNESPLAVSANPSALSIPYTIDEIMTIVGETLND